MFKGIKTNIFWLGLLILGIAIVTFFGSLWYPIVIYVSYSCGLHLTCGSASFH